MTSYLEKVTSDLDSVLRNLPSDMQCNHDQARFWMSIIPGIRVFIFNEKQANSVPVIDFKEPVPNAHIAMPFPACFFEAGNPEYGVLRTPEGAVIRAVMAAEVNPEMHIVTCFADDLRIYETLVMQKRRFYNYSLSLFGQEMKLEPQEEFVEWMNHMSRQVLTPVLCRLQNGRLFKSNDSIRMKAKHWKTENLNPIQRVQNIIYIGRRNQDQMITPSGKHLQYSSRFEVRGHWRKMTGNDIHDNPVMGKDRHGNRRIPGYTWINPYTKGDSELPLIRKIRVMTPDDEALMNDT